MAHGDCTVNKTCTCNEGYETGASGSCDTLEAVEEPTAFLPVIVAGIGLMVFCLVLSVLRFREARRLNSAAGKAAFTVDSMDVTLAVLAVHLAHKVGVEAPPTLQSNSSAVRKELDGADVIFVPPAPVPEPVP